MFLLRHTVKQVNKHKKKTVLFNHNVQCCCDIIFQFHYQHFKELQYCITKYIYMYLK